MVIGTGVDIVETERVRRLVAVGGERFLLRCFDMSEILYCRAKAKPHLHLAARLAAKEAAFKALKLPGGGPLCWRDIVVRSDPDGAPCLVLTGEPRAAQDRLGAGRLHLSLSHCESYAIAMVTIEG